MSEAKNIEGNSFLETQEIQETTTRSVSCDGGKGALGHPKVYLQIKPNEESITCPYCSRKFVLV